MKRIIAALLLVWSGAAVIAATRIADPETFVRGVYEHYVASQRTKQDYSAPADIYTPRLKALMDEDKRRANGEVGCIDFDFWVNGQDSELKDVQVTAESVAGNADRKMVVAKFTNFKPQEIHFDFRRMGGNWLIDDVESVRDEKWKLSALVSCWKK